MFGTILRRAREARGVFFVLMLAALALLLGLNFLITNEHPHFGGEKYPGFWALFGLAGSVGMTLLLKKIVFPIISKPEDYYAVPVEPSGAGHPAQPAHHEREDSHGH